MKNNNNNNNHAGQNNPLAMKLFRNLNKLKKKKITWDSFQVYQHNIKF